MEQLRGQVWWVSLCVISTLVCSSIRSEAQPSYFTNKGLLSQAATDSQAQETSAKDLFRTAYHNRYTWDTEFPGYTAAVEVKLGRNSYRGNIRVNSDLSVEVTGIDQKEANETITNQLQMLVVHRRRLPFELTHKNSIFKLGPTDSTGAVEVVEQGDSSEAVYKISNQQVVQVNRSIGPHAFTVDTLGSQITPEGYMATRYRTTAFQPQTKQVLGKQVSEDTYQKIGEYYLPTRQVIQHSEAGVQQQIEVNFTNLQLLKNR